MYCPMPRGAVKVTTAARYEIGPLFTSLLDLENTNGLFYPTRMLRVCWPQKGCNLKGLRGVSKTVGASQTRMC